MLPLFKKILNISDKSFDLDFYTVNLVESPTEFISLVNLSMAFSIKALISVTVNCKTTSYLIDVDNPPIELENGLIYDFLVESNKIKSFKFKPKKDGSYDIRYVEFINFIGDVEALKIFIQNNTTSIGLNPDNITDSIYSVTMDNGDTHLFIKTVVENIGNLISFDEYSSTCKSINPLNFQLVTEPIFSKSINCLSKIKYNNKLLLKTTLQSKINIISRRIEYKLINKLYNMYKELELVLHKLKCKFSDLVYNKKLKSDYSLKDCNENPDEILQLSYYIDILKEKIKLLRYNFKNPTLVDISYFGRLNKLNINYFFEKESYLTNCNKIFLEKII
jgi:hypothetical protein